MKAASIHSWKALWKRARSAGVLLLLVVGLLLQCRAAELILIRSTAERTLEQRELELATEFYGVDIRIVTAAPAEMGNLQGLIRQKSTVAVAIEASALTSVNRQELLSFLRRGESGVVPLLVLGVTPKTDKTALTAWSEGAVRRVKSLHATSLRYAIGSMPGLTEQLSGIEIQANGGDAFYFDLGTAGKAEVVMEIESGTEKEPVLIHNRLRGQDSFVLCGKPVSGGVVAASEAMEDAFGKLAPVMMFVRWSAGERAWHSVHHYANLTIDDPWLHEPYGNLSYAGLLAEMDRHRFHTTIAFVPWNFDRSEPNLVALFRRRPDRFSICIHGDNHDHKEFADYPSKPLDAQIALMGQSLARMRRFQELTGIPYDKVMVFPHSIAPVEVLKALKADNYLATVNSENVPMGVNKPANDLFAMRPVTLAYAGFPSILRDSADVPTRRAKVAINEFLGNPLLYYTHQNYFSKGIGAFDGIADEVNQIGPTTVWAGLGEIVRHLYLEKLREDSNYDVLAFSASLQLENPSGRDAVFYVSRQETADPAIASVSVDGKEQKYELRDGYLHLRVPLPAGATRSVEIQYRNNLNLASISTAKISPRVYFLRSLSDFRDITMSKNYFGSALVRLYYKSGRGPKATILWMLGLVVSAAGLVLLLKALWRRHFLRRVRGVAADEAVACVTSSQKHPSPGDTGTAQPAASEAYVLITAAHNEEKYIEHTIRSVVAQRRRPARWVIVNDGSTDGSEEIIRSYADQYEFIQAVTLDASHKESFASKARALRAGYQRLSGVEYEFIGILDADIAMYPDYYGAVLEMFHADRQLGIAGGSIHESKRGKFRSRSGNRTRSVAGAVQLFRRPCYEAIGGIQPFQHGGEDWFAEVSARMHGWEVRTNLHLQVLHLRATRGRDNLLRAWFRQGKMDFSLGSHPTFEVVKCLRRLTDKPWLFGGLARLAGFVWSYWGREKRVVSEEFVRFLRHEQSLRLIPIPGRIARR